MGSHKTAVALLETELVMTLAGLLRDADQLADILKAREAFLQLHAVLSGNQVRHVGGNDGLHKEAVIVQKPELPALGQKVFAD